MSKLSKKQRFGLALGIILIKFTNDFTLIRPMGPSGPTDRLISGGVCHEAPSPYYWAYRLRHRHIGCCGHHRHRHRRPKGGGTKICVASFTVNTLRRGLYCLFSWYKSPLSVCFFTLSLPNWDPGLHSANTVRSCIHCSWYFMISFTGTATKRSITQRLRHKT
jgi:hypothetical protein